MAAVIFFLCAALPRNSIREGQAAEIMLDEDGSPMIYANNLTCPVSEDDIVVADAVQYKYNGKIYYFCCESCLKHFKKYPEKFAHKAHMF
jgi:YHS domain-containing protein